MFKFKVTFHGTTAADGSLAIQTAVDLKAYVFSGAVPLGRLGGGAPPCFLLSNHFLFSAKKCLYANKRNQDKPLSRKRVYSKHKSIQSLRMPKFRVLKIKNAEVCFENWNHPLQINLKPRFTERKSREDESKKSWRLMCVRSKKIFTG